MYTHSIHTYIYIFSPCQEKLRLERASSFSHSTNMSTHRLLALCQGPYARSGFLLPLLTSGAASFPVVGGRPGHGRIFSSIPALYPPDAQSILPPGVTKTSADIAKCPLGVSGGGALAKSPLTGSCCFLWTNSQNPPWEAGLLVSSSCRWGTQQGEVK